MKPGDKGKEAGSRDRGQVSSAVLSQGRTLVGRETLQEGDFLTMMTWVVATQD